MDWDIETELNESETQARIDSIASRCWSLAHRVDTNLTAEFWDGEYPNETLKDAVQDLRRMRRLLHELELRNAGNLTRK